MPRRSILDTAAAAVRTAGAVGSAGVNGVGSSGSSGSTRIATTEYVTAATNLLGGSMGLSPRSQTYVVPRSLNIPADVFDDMVAAIRRQYERAIGAPTGLPLTDGTMTLASLRQAISLIENIPRNGTEPVRLMILAEESPAVVHANQQADVARQAYSPPENPVPAMLGSGEYDQAGQAITGSSFWAGQAVPPVRRRAVAVRPTQTYHSEGQEEEDL